MQDLNSIGDVEARAGACERCAAVRGEPTVDRLTFLKQSAAAIAAVALAACGAGSLTAPESLSATTIALASNPALANVGGVTTMSIDHSPVAIVRESSTTFAAFSLICPHQGSTVQARTSDFRCPGHGATFSFAGTWTGGQRTSNLKSYPAVYDSAAGTVIVGG